MATPFKPNTELGRLLLALRDAYIAKGGPLYDFEDPPRPMHIYAERIGHVEEAHYTFDAHAGTHIEVSHREGETLIRIESSPCGVIPNEPIIVTDDRSITLTICSEPYIGERA